MARAQHSSKAESRSAPTPAPTQPSPAKSPAPIKCFVLMPFSPVQTLVFSHGIMQAINAINTATGSAGPILDCDRADFIYEPRYQKVEAIIEALKRSDVVIVDVTSYNPNVMWELGLCHALNKPAIRIRAENLHAGPEHLPFNIQGLDLIKYTLSTEGLEQLANSLRARLQEQIKEARKTLHGDPVIRAKYEAIGRELGEIHQDSILRELVAREIDRLNRRTEVLRKGQFDLRNQKEPREVADYYSEYLEQLDGRDCEFMTITHFDFWKAITVGGGYWRYLQTNRVVARSGTQIRRVFLLDTNRPLTAEESELRDKILVELKEADSTCKCHVLAGDAGVGGKYKNYGLLIKGSEQLLFEPVYDANTNRMIRTDFAYVDTRLADQNWVKENSRKVTRFRNSFEEAFSTGESITTYLSRPKV